MLLHCNSTKLAKFEHFKTCSGGRFLWTVYNPQCNFKVTPINWLGNELLKNIF